jgi:PAS domain S-box-containing protein
VLVIVVYSGLEHRATAWKNVENYSVQLVHDGARHQELATANSLQLLSTLAQVSDVRQANAPACSILFSNLLYQNASYSTLFLADASGNIRAAGTPLTNSINITDRKYFIDAKEKGQFSFGEYVFSRTSRKKTFHFALPIKDESQRVVSVLVAGLDLENFEYLVTKAGHSIPEILVATDYKGIVLYDSAETSSRVGQPDDQVLFKRMAQGPAEGVFLEKAEDNQEYLIAYEQLSISPYATPYLYLRSGMLKERAIAETRSALLRNIALLALVAMAAAIAAWVVGEKSLVKPIQGLAAAAHDFGRGDWQIRTKLPHARHELGRLAATFDEMAAALSNREEARNVAESSLRASEEKFRNLFVTMAQGVLYLDRTGRILSANPAAEELLGTTWEEMKNTPPGQQPLQFIHEDGSPCPLADSPANVALRTGKPVHNVILGIENRNRKTLVWILSNAIPQYESGNSAPAQVFITMTDITGRKQIEIATRELNEQLEQRVRQRTAQLEEANLEMEAFSYSVSHDLRAPLRHINGFVEILLSRQNPSLDAETMNYLQMISTASRKLGALIDDLLHLSRTRRAELTIQTVDFNLQVREIVRDLSAETPQRSIRWNVSPLPPVLGDPILLRQVWINLLSNAVKYTRKRPQAEISIGARVAGDGQCVFSVKDNGVGFDMRYAGKLFGVFQRLHRVEDFEGSGIGLANVRRCINRLGGRVWAEGVVDVGATFYFSLPAAPAA